ncbi:intercellular adhesion molecule 2-like isoform X1 [Osmerus mordax]|uniref:intercellular adhesion molecule 2-like isoform X1 n=2 Tax=Osmerus mordax TaxID=8014 RepID=UPI00350ED829
MINGIVGVFSWIIVVTGGLTQTVSHLEMNPSRLVVRYGDSVSVNCSTSVADPDGMGWEASDGATGLIEDVTWVMWTVESLEDWDGSPKCFINLKNGDQHKETLGVTLYHLPDIVSISPLNHTGPMVEGTEYQLQCDVLNVAPVRNLTVTWYKGNETIKTDSYGDQSKTPVNKSSILTITPSREDDGALYRCEAQLNLGPEGPHPSPVNTSEHHNILVHYPPVFLSSSTKTFELRNGDEVTFNCTATGNPAPVYSWQTSQPQENMGDQPLFTSSSLLPGTYNCTASNDIGKQTKLFIMKRKGSSSGTTAGIVMALLALVALVSVCMVYQKQRSTLVTGTGIAGPQPYPRLRQTGT